jgi:hypothetical protein
VPASVEQEEHLVEVFVHGWLGRVDLSGWAELAAVTVAPECLCCVHSARRPEGPTRRVDLVLREPEHMPESSDQLRLRTGARHLP